MRNARKLIALNLALLLLISLLPTAALAAEDVFTLGTVKHFSFTQNDLPQDNLPPNGYKQVDLPLGTFTPSEAGYYRVYTNSRIAPLSVATSPSIYLYDSNGTMPFLGDIGSSRSDETTETYETDSVSIFYLSAGQKATIKFQIGIEVENNSLKPLTSFDLDAAVYKVADDHILTAQNGSCQVPAQIDGDKTGANVCIIPSYQFPADGWYIPVAGDSSVFYRFKGMPGSIFLYGWYGPRHFSAAEQYTITFSPRRVSIENFSAQAVELPELSENGTISNTELWEKSISTYYGLFTPEKSGKYMFTAETTGEGSAWVYCGISTDPYVAQNSSAYENDRKIFKMSVTLEKNVQYLVEVNGPRRANGAFDEDAPFTLSICQDTALPEEDILVEANRYGLLRYAHFEEMSENLTRLDFAKLLVKANEFNLDLTNPVLSFTDCDELSLQEKAIVKAAADAELLYGYSDGTFHPNDWLTRAQVAFVLSKLPAISSATATGEKTYSDTSVHWASDAVTKLLNLGITPDTEEFIPDATASRKDVLEMLVRACYGGYIDAVYAASYLPRFFESSVSMEVGQTFDLRNISNGAVNFEMSDESIIDVNVTIMTALKPGTAAVYAYGENGSFAKTTVTVTGNINTCTVEGLAANGYVYTGSAITPDITVKDGNTVLSEGTDYSLTYENNTAAGTATITVSGMGNYTGTKDISFSITKAPLTITAKDKTITYGEAPANDGVSYTGFVNGETEAVVSGLSYTYTYTQYGNVGSYAINPTGATADNYQITLKPGKLTVEKKTVGLTWAGHSDLYYDGQAKAVTATATGLVNNDAVTVTVAGGAQKDAGSYTAKATGLSGAKAANYKLPDDGLTQSYSIAYALESVSVTPATVTATVDQSTRTIKLVGYRGEDETVELTGLTVADGKVTVNGVEYTVDDAGVVVNESNAELTEAPAQVEKPEDAEDSITDAVVTEINDPATGSEGLDSASAEYIFGEAAKDESIDAVEVSVSIQPKDLTEISIKLEIKPVVTYKSGEEVVKTETIPNDAIKAPVTVSVKLPAGMPTVGLFAKHYLSGGQVEFLKVTVTAGVASWQQSSFSEVELVADSRSATVNFVFENGSGQSATYTAADIGKALPTDSKSGSSFQGWLIDGGTAAQRTLTDELLTALDGKTVAAVPSFRTTGGGFVPGGSVTTQPEKPANPFVDVFTQDYYYDAVLWAVKEGITSGMSETIFAPDNSCTRAQAVTFLWRAAGKPQATSTVNPLEDVSAGDYYYQAVLWAVEQGIAAGVSETSFAPEATVTRGQMMTFMWRMGGKPVVGAGNVFSDISASDYYHDAVAWAVEKGITVGTGTTTFSPAANCTRGQIVTFLHRLMGK